MILQNQQQLTGHGRRSVIAVSDYGIGKWVRDCNKWCLDTEVGQWLLWRGVEMHVKSERKWLQIVKKNEVHAMDMSEWCYDYIDYDFMDIYRYQILPHYDYHTI